MFITAIVRIVSILNNEHDDSNTKLSYPLTLTQQQGFHCCIRAPDHDDNDVTSIDLTMILCQCGDEDLISASVSVARLAEVSWLQIMTMMIRWQWKDYDTTLTWQWGFDCCIWTPDSRSWQQWYAHDMMPIRWSTMRIWLLHQQQGSSGVLVPTSWWWQWWYIENNMTILQCGYNNDSTLQLLWRQRYNVSMIVAWVARQVAVA